MSVHLLREWCSWWPNRTENGALPFKEEKMSRCYPMTCDRKTEHVRSFFPWNVSARPENGAFPFTILLFLTLLVCRSESNIQYTTMAGKTKEMSQIKQLLLLNPSLIFNCPFFLLSSTLRFSFAALCTTNFSRFWIFWRAFSYTLVVDRYHPPICSARCKASCGPSLQGRWWLPWWQPESLV